MSWDGDALAGQMEEIFERQQGVADARSASRSSPNSRTVSSIR